MNGFIVGVTITDEGFGYTNTPSARILGGNGTGAELQASVADGVVTAVRVLKPGSGYTGTPSVVIGPPPFPPQRATAIAQVAGGSLVGLTVADGGHGYSEPPTIIIAGGLGAGATAIAVISEGAVTSFIITNPGTGYTRTPSVVIASPPFLPSLGFSVRTVKANLHVVLGNQYLLESSKDLATWTAVGAPFVAQEEDLIRELDVTETGQYFRVTTAAAALGGHVGIEAANVHTVSLRQPVAPAPRRAAATLQIVNGFIVGVAVTDGGSGYPSAPSVLISGGNGTGAQLQATVADGVVTAIQVLNPGSGYTGVPRVLVASPPFVPTLGIAVSRVRVDLHAVLGKKYLLESSKGLADWAPVGAAFVAQEEDVSQEFDVTETGQYFRVTQVQ